jgi:hypothetical protein
MPVQIMGQALISKQSTIFFAGIGHLLVSPSAALENILKVLRWNKRPSELESLQNGGKASPYFRGCLAFSGIQG